MNTRHAVNRGKLRILPAVRRMPAGARDRLLGEPPGTLERMARLGLRPVGVVEVAVDELLLQRPVRCELIPVHEATTLDFLDRYMSEDGVSDWRMARSPHVRLLEQHRDRGLPDDLTLTDYWRWHERLAQAGINERPPEMIARKVCGLVEVYESMSRDGYRYTGLRSYVWALERPLISTRYGIDHRPAGVEVYDGHHRAAAAAALGWKRLHVLVLRDVATTTPFGLSLDDVSRP